MTAPAAAVAERPGGSVRRAGWGVAVVAAGTVALVPVAAGVPLPLLVVALVAVALTAVAYANPAAAAYVLVVATPLTAGLGRSGLIPLLRPHEALGVTLGAGVVLRAVAQLRAGHRLPLRINRIDVSILSMAVAGSVLPLLWMAARGLAPTREDLLYALALWKFYGLFVLIRACVRTERQVSRCLLLSVAAGGVVAVVAILQATQIGGVADFVGAVYPDEDAPGTFAGRGSATIGSSIGVGDVLAFNLAICLAWLLHRRRPSRLLMGGAAVLMMLGGLASGQFSGVIAIAVAVVTVAVVTGNVRRLFLASVPTALVGLVVLWPVVQARLANVETSTGLPQSWRIRLQNLREFVWPEVFTGQNWLFGVRPSTRIVADVPWGPTIYIESGHTWLLWTGGVPLFVAFLVFISIGVRATASIARRFRDGRGIAATASLAGLLVVFVLMSFDPHITMRGTADLLFTLLALATTGWPAAGARGLRARLAPVGDPPHAGDVAAGRRGVPLA